MTRGRSGLNVAGSVFQGAFQLTVNWRGDIRPNARASFHPSDLGGQRDTKVTRKDTKTQQDSLPRLSDEQNNTVAEPGEKRGQSVNLKRQLNFGNHKERKDTQRRETAEF